ncbi:MAG TPA: hypothetical protein VM142_10055 [Acidimicrobiales bacterium]|nr:hypothetical protein [Acidimicrobiales bacterium]
MSDPLAIELATFRKHRDELVGSSLNRYVLIHGDQIVSTYESEQDAINEGYRQFGNVTFLVKRITPVDLPLNFLSGLVRL